MISADNHTAINVQSPDGEYPILLGRGLVAQMGALAREAGLGRRVVVASDSNVAPVYGEVVLGSLRANGFDPYLVVMSAGEAHKTWDSVGVFVEEFLDAGLDRSGWVLALGGGVVGDTVGFAASVYMRGVTLVQAPTTLLAMADSSIGGKVGVDHPRGKNMLGAFKQPRMVVADLATLDTLPGEQIACGLAEIIKAGVIADPALFALIEGDAPDKLDLREALMRAIVVKRDIVQRDPHEAGERALLNLGHTFGHAFERCTGYGRLHGFAVGQGMVVAARLAGRLGMCDLGLEARLRAMLEKWRLPVRWGAPDLLDDSAVERVWEAMLMDKKRRDGSLRLVLPEDVGRVKLVSGASEDEVKHILRELQ